MKPLNKRKPELKYCWDFLELRSYLHVKVSLYFFFREDFLHRPHMFFCIVRALNQHTLIIIQKDEFFGILLDH